MPTGKAGMEEIATPWLCIGCWKRVLGSFLFFLPIHDDLHKLLGTLLRFAGLLFLIILLVGAFIFRVQFLQIMRYKAEYHWNSGTHYRCTERECTRKFLIHQKYNATAHHCWGLQKIMQLSGYRSRICTMFLNRTLHNNVMQIFKEAMLIYLWFKHR